MVERLARKLEPQAWAALGTGDTLAYANRRKSSQRKAMLCINEMRELTPEMRAAAAYYLGKSIDISASRNIVLKHVRPSDIRSGIQCGIIMRVYLEQSVSPIFAGTFREQVSSRQRRRR